MPPVGDAIDTVGAVASGGGPAAPPMVALTLVDGVELFPAASKALTVYEYVVAAVRPVLEYVCRCRRTDHHTIAIHVVSNHTRRYQSRRSTRG